MRAERIINRLNKRLEEKYPLEIIPADNQQEGINTWKGKRIIPVDQWAKITAILEKDKVIFDLRKGFDYFPDSTCEVIFQLGVEGSEEYYKEIPKKEFEKWFNDYLDLLSFKKNTELGKMICKNCLLSPHKDRSGLLIGVHKLVTKILHKELEEVPQYPMIITSLQNILLKMVQYIPVMYLTIFLVLMKVRIKTISLNMTFKQI